MIKFNLETVFTTSTNYDLAYFQDGRITGIEVLTRNLNS